jgi:hypothetical protein
LTSDYAWLMAAAEGRVPESMVPLILDLSRLKKQLIASMTSYKIDGGRSD